MILYLFYILPMWNKGGLTVLMEIIKCTIMYDYGMVHIHYLFYMNIFVYTYLLNIIVIYSIWLSANASFKVPTPPL